MSLCYLFIFVLSFFKFLLNVSMVLFCLGSLSSVFHTTSPLYISEFLPISVFIFFTSSVLPLRVFTQVSISSITIPPRTPGIYTKHLPPPWGFCIQAFARGGGDLLGQLPRGGHLSINDVCHISNFHYNGKNW